MVYDSSVEERWGREADRVLGKVFPDMIVEKTVHHPMTLRMESIGGNDGRGVKYTPDFLHLLSPKQGDEDYLLAVLVECKGWKGGPNYRDSDVRLRVCAAVYPFFLFLRVMPASTRAWRVQIIDGETDDELVIPVQHEGETEKISQDS